MVFFICHGLYKCPEYLFVMAPTGQTARQSPQNSQASGWSPLATTWLKPPFFAELQRVDHGTSLQTLMHSAQAMQRFMLKSSTKLRVSSGINFVWR